MSAHTVRVDQASYNQPVEDYLEVRMKDFDMKYLDVYKPTGNYIIGQVNYYEGDERL